MINLKQTSAIGMMLLAAGTAQAREAGVPSSVPPGNTIGVPIAAPLPPGIYFSSHSGYWSTELKDGNGEAAGQSNTLADTALQFIWSPGINIFSGDYKAFVTLPLLYNDQTRTAPFPLPLQGFDDKFAVGNIEISPINLSWAVAPGIFVSTGFSIFAPTGDFDAAAAINSGGDFWTFAPSVGYSYLRNGWNVSLHASYFTNTENSATNYRSGDEVLVNFTALKDVGNFSVGPVGYYRKQVTADENNGAFYGGGIQGKSEQAALGVGFSKRFGSVDANLNLTRDLHVRNAVGGSKLWLNFTVPLGEPGK